MKFKVIFLTLIVLDFYSVQLLNFSHFYLVISYKLLVIYSLITDLNYQLYIYWLLVISKCLWILPHILGFLDEIINKSVTNL